MAIMRFIKIWNKDVTKIDFGPTGHFNQNNVLALIDKRTEQRKCKDDNNKTNNTIIFKTINLKAINLIVEMRYMRYASATHLILGVRLSFLCVL